MNRIDQSLLKPPPPPVPPPNRRVREFPTLNALLGLLLLLLALLLPGALWGQQDRTLAAAAQVAGCCGPVTPAKPNPCFGMRTSWVSGCTKIGGTPALGQWNPAGQTVLERYGDDHKCFLGHTVANQTGIHTQNPNGAADQYVLQVLPHDPLRVENREIVGDRWAELDIHYVDGLAACIMRLARERGLAPPLAAPVTCPNGICGRGETPANCPQDCPVAPPPEPTPPPPPPVPVPPVPVPEPVVDPAILARLAAVEAAQSDVTAALTAGVRRIEAVEAKATASAGDVAGLTATVAQLWDRVARLEAVTKPPVPPAPPVPTPDVPDPPAPPAGTEVFTALDFTVTPEMPVLHASWKPAKRYYREVRLEMSVEIDRLPFTGKRGEKANLFWLAQKNNLDMIGYALLTAQNLVVSEGLGMKQDGSDGKGGKERVTDKGLAPGVYQITYTWGEGAAWDMEVRQGAAVVRSVTGKATGRLDFRKGPLLLDIGYPGAPDSVEIPTPGWRFSDVRVTLEER